MTTDPTPLQKRIAEALAEHWRRKHSTLLTSGPCSGCSRAAADAAAAEARKAQADALREYAEALEAVPDYAPTEYDKGRVDQRHAIVWELHVRVTEHEQKG